MDLLNYVIDNTNTYIEKMPKRERKKYGQFFTSQETASFMAALFSISADCTKLKILDPGAGSGILSAALLERLQSYSHLQEIHLVCYEINPDILSLLKQNLEYLQKNSAVSLTYEIRTENYILHQEASYNNNLEFDTAQEKFDFIIANPPYMKLPKSAPEVKAMQDICYGAPNIYFLFAYMSLFNLKQNGELVYILPRSWTSGLYFKRFRQKFLHTGALQHIHLFTSRDKVFTNESVLQETMIIKVKKTLQPSHTVTVTSTDSNSDFSAKTEFTVPYSTIVYGENHYVYLVTNKKELHVLERLHRLKNTLPDIGLKMKTGLTVDFRHKDVLKNTSDKTTVPLFYPQHIQKGSIAFPIGKENEYILTKKPGLLQKNSNYLFIKRFTAKEEHRRLQCGIYLSKQYPEYEQISTQNKINFITGTHILAEYTVYGLYALFNSTLYDQYYRILNGSTQVNSSEINSMPVPNMETINSIGRQLLSANDLSEKTCDKILKEYL